MNDATRVYINKVADAVRSTFDVPIPIDNIDSLVNKLGGSIVEKNTAVDQKVREANPAQASPGKGHNLAVNAQKESSKPTKTNISISDLLFENGKRKEQNV